MPHLNHVALQLVEGGRGILAADESIKTMSSRLSAEGVEPSRTNRRDYRELLLMAPGLSETVSGIILSEETFDDYLGGGGPFPGACEDAAVLPGVKVDAGTTELPRAGGALITEGLDGLGPRLADFAKRGARFAKWRAVIDVTTVTDRSLDANADALARYAASCQENHVVPIVEPEVLCTGSHPMSRCAEVSSAVLAAVFHHLELQGVDLSAIVLKPNMVTPGLDAEPAAPAEVASATLDVLLSAVPEEVPGVAFLSGGHPSRSACEYLGAINDLAGRAPWSLTFSFGRALVSDALHAWKGDPEQVRAAQEALLANCRRAADAVRRRASYAGTST